MIDFNDSMKYKICDYINILPFLFLKNKKVNHSINLKLNVTDLKRGGNKQQCTPTYCF